jgi:7-cyano-7-deazaguanine synthase
MSALQNSAAGKRAKSVVLLSGGLDSSANLALCHAWDDPVLALTIDYGQKAASREIRAARALCELYGVRHETLDLRWLGGLGGSALTQADSAIPDLPTAQLDDMAAAMRTAKAVWVPNRNGVLINAAAAYAEKIGATRVIVGFNREEAATFPDNSVAYLEQASRALGFSTANGVAVFSYTAELDKREIVAELRALKAPAFPFDLVWSCYTGAETPCGHCESCRRLARALGSQP